MRASKADKNHEETAIYKILRPQYAPLGKNFDEWITAASPSWQRIAVENLSICLSLETGFREEYEECKEIWRENNTTVYPIITFLPCKDGKDRNALIGILKFLKRGENPVLYHCYVHPFFRKKGEMAKAWEAVKTKFPMFEVERPLSPAMESFMSRVNCSHVLPST